MLRISDSELRFVSHGYHFDDHGRKYIRVYASLYFVEIHVRIPKHKEMHIRAITPDFPYKIWDNWVVINVARLDIPNIGNPWTYIENYIDNRLKEVWFV